MGMAETLVLFTIENLKYIFSCALLIPDEEDRKKYVSENAKKLNETIDIIKAENKYNFYDTEQRGFTTIKKTLTHLYIQEEK